MMTPRERVEAALLGRWADRVPFTAYENKVSPCEVVRKLRNEGLCIVERRVPVFEVEAPDVSEKTIRYHGEDGMMRLRTVIQTPRGTISTVLRERQGDVRIPEELLPWREEYFFKDPEDYAPIEFMIRNRRYRPTYEVFRQAQEKAGGDVFLTPRVGGYTPLQEILVRIMGVERFSIEWAERRDEVMKLYQALTADRRKVYPLLAESPAIAVNYGGNIIAEVMGVERFRKYVLPHHRELAEILHKRGKVLGSHLDGHHRLLASAVAEAPLDYVEAFTPLPTGDMSVAEARAAWPDKVLWINFPSSVHLEEPEAIEEATRQILREAAPGNGFLIGITESVPPDKWQASFSAISRVIKAKGQLPLG